MKKILKNTITFSIIIAFTFSFLFLMLIKNKNKIYGINKNFEELMLINNSNNLFDKGFSEESLKGGQNYIEHYRQNYHNKNKSFGVILPKETENIDFFRTLLSFAIDNNAKNIFSSGYQFIESSVGGIEEISGKNFGIDGDISVRKNNGVYFKDFFLNEKNKSDYLILVDDQNYDTFLSRNIIKFSFETNSLGFLSGVVSSIWTTYNNVYKVSTFGGQPLKTVIPILSGFEQGVNWFNYKVLGYDINGKKSNEEAFLFNSKKYNKKIEITNGSNEDYYVDYQKKHTNIDDWYSGSFNLGEGQTISARQLDSGSNVIFPVAGSQKLDALNQIATSGNDKNQIIGVDSDLSLNFPKKEKYILGSAIKNISKATELGIWYSEIFINKNNQKENKLNDSEYDQKMLSDLKSWKEKEKPNTSRDLSLLSNEEANSYFDLKDKEKLKNSSFVFDEKNNKFKTNYGDYGKQLKYGSMFKGNFENKGIDFVFDEREDSKLNIAFNDLLNEALIFNDYIDVDSNVSTLLKLGLLENKKIEKYSKTFTLENYFPISSPNELPWIPNWDSY